MAFLSKLRADWALIKGSAKSLLIVTTYRASSYFAQNESRSLRLVGAPVRVLYELLIEFLLGVELPDRVVAGPGLSVFDGVGLVVNAKVGAKRHPPTEHHHRDQAR